MIERPSREILEKSRALVSDLHKALGMKYGEGGPYASYVSGYSQAVEDVMRIIRETPFGIKRDD